MSSLLTIEDGTGIADANSYADATEARDYAAARGVTLPAAPGSGIDQVETWLILAAEFLDSLDWIGLLASTGQGLKWPRVLTAPYLDKPYIPCYGFHVQYPLDSTLFVMVANVKKAQNQLVVEQSNGIALFPSTPGGIEGQVVTRERVDVIETSYSDRFGAPMLPTMPKVNAMLKDLLYNKGLRSERV
jgi:hypothetical protein